MPAPELPPSLTESTGAAPSEPQKQRAFSVTLENFTGPFDLLLGLIAKHQLDITEIALAQVTDEFIAHMDAHWDVSQASEFLVVAATLLEIKAARLLPQQEREAEEDLEFLEARDLLFARLLQYRTFKEAAAWMGQRLAVGETYLPREVGLEAPFAALLPELVWHVRPEELARRAAAALSRRPPEVAVAHLHEVVVPVPGQMKILAALLRTAGQATFSHLIADAASTAVVVSRFLALLELYRAGVVEFEQDEHLGPLTVQWTGDLTSEVGTGTDEYDEGVA